MTALQLGGLVQNGEVAALLSKLDQQILADVGVGHLPPAEPDGDLAPVALAQELLGVAQLHIEVVDIDAGRHANLLDLHYPLILAGFLLALGLFEPVFAVVHKLTHRGYGVGGDLDQIQIALLCQAQGLLRGHDAQLFAGLRDQPDLFVANLFIGLMTCVSDGKAPPDKIKMWAAGKAPTSQQNNAGSPAVYFHVNPLAVGLG